MEQTLEWAISESGIGGAFGVGARTRAGTLTDDYVGMMRSALQQYLRKINNQSEINVKEILAEWAERGWIQKDSGGKNTVWISVDGQRPRMVKILLGAEGLPEVIEYTPIVKVEGEKGTVVRMSGI